MTTSAPNSRPADQLVGDTAPLDMAALADRAAIADVISAFALCYDAGDFKALGDLLTDDARYQVEAPPPGVPPLVIGRTHITAGMNLMWRHNRETLRLVHRHVITNVLVSRLGTSAPEARSVLTVTTLDAGGNCTLTRIGAYHDWFRREGSRWRIAHRKLSLAQPLPAS